MKIAYKNIHEKLHFHRQSDVLNIFLVKYRNISEELYKKIKKYFIKIVF